jgi:CheY-like chemotaxis protein/HPt (histidine-containing phosphotransfer) domain-containing protein
MQMPGMDGAALARAIKANDALRDTRLILMTSLGQPGAAGIMEKVGFAAYVIKPVRQSELCACLSTVLTAPPSDLPARPILATHTVQETLNRFAGRKARILLAEDIITNQLVAVAILKTMGLKADVVANGTEAVKALETLPYDLVLMDAQMPELDGLEATVQIRSPNSHVFNPRVPIIAMTAGAMQGDREKCLAAGMDDYVTKPVSPQTLAVVLDKWLPKESTPRTVPAGLPAEAISAPAQLAVPVFDRDGLMNRVMNDWDLMKQVTECFILETPRQIAALREYLESGDVEGARRQAHALRGAAANVGGESLRAVATAMETAAKGGDLVTVKALLTDLQVQFEALREAMGGSPTANPTG